MPLMYENISERERSTVNLGLLRMIAIKANSFHSVYSPTSGGRSFGIVRSRIKATEFVLFSYKTSDSFPLVCIVY
jgi:hypothetical protein